MHRRKHDQQKGQNDGPDGAFGAGHSTTSTCLPIWSSLYVAQSRSARIRGIQRAVALGVMAVGSPAGGHGLTRSAATRWGSIRGGSVIVCGAWAHATKNRSDSRGTDFVRFTRNMVDLLLGLGNG